MCKIQLSPTQRGSDKGGNQLCQEPSFLQSLPGCHFEMESLTKGEMKSLQQQPSPNKATIFSEETRVFFSAERSSSVMPLPQSSVHLSHTETLNSSVAQVWDLGSRISFLCLAPPTKVCGWLFLPLWTIHVLAAAPARVCVCPCTKGRDFFKVSSLSCSQRKRRSKARPLRERRRRRRVAAVGMGGTQKKCQTNTHTCQNAELLRAGSWLPLAFRKTSRGIRQDGESSKDRW